MVGGIVCWVLAILSLFVPVEFHLLLISAAITIAWLLPGWYMRKKYLKQIIDARQ
jgi:FtsH-binding integral membrane protein